MPVFGADPDSDVTAWAEYEGPRRVFASKPVNELTSYFTYHPEMKMSQVSGDEDKTVLNAFFSRKLKQGYTVDSLKTMINRFWQSWGAGTQRPAYTFTSNKVQQELGKEAEIVKGDPVLSWLLEGMPNRGPFEDNVGMRKVILRHSVEGVYRYPEVVADIITHDDGDEALVLDELDNIISWKLDREDAPDRNEVYLAMLSRKANMPPELMSKSKGKVRPAFDTVTQAVANIPLQKALEW